MGRAYTPSEECVREKVGQSAGGGLISKGGLLEENYSVQVSGTGVSEEEGALMI